MSLKILFATSEVHPLVKTGGLADVSSALPAALRRLGHDARLVIPGYPQVFEGIADLKPTNADALHTPGGDVRVLEGVMPDTGVPVYVVEADHLYNRVGGPYHDPGGHDWGDNAIRFATLAKVAAILGETGSPLGWRPDIVHANDWQTGLTPWYLATSAVSHARTVMTIHNLAYQGLYDRELMDALWLPPHAWHPDGLEYHGHLSLMKAGVAHAPAVTTVSPTYAKEIQTEAFGFGLDGLLRHRASALTGIVNGIDSDAWNPATDELITRNYTISSLKHKADNKLALQEALGLTVNKKAFLVGVVGRMAHQKGLDLLAEITARLVDEDIQVAVLGSGESWLEQRFESLAARYPGAVATTIGYNETLAHQMEAGLDAFIMPSRYEPCGLNQIYSMAYGTVPIVRNTGGLADTVIDVGFGRSTKAGATGFVFDDASSEDLFEAILRAQKVFRSKARWPRVQKNGMKADWTWDASAADYVKVYKSVLAE